MIDRIRNWFNTHTYARWFYPCCLIITAFLFVTGSKQNNGYWWLYFGIAVLLFFAFRPNSILHLFSVEKFNSNKMILSILVAFITIAVCILPMDNLSLWNGEVPGHRNQYELMAEAILDGRIEFAYGDEDQLSKLENPYDPNERAEAGITYHWDHVYYDGHYYMYFGIVPVFLVFLPYRLITGESLTTFHATQIFAALAIVGIFVLFHLLSKLFFKKLPFIAYLSLSAAFSVMSIWYSSAEPALYCTAITSAMALEIWSLYFFIRAVWGETKENKQIFLAFIGAVLGALVFGCRPPIALANILVIPMVIVFLKQRKITLKLLGKLLLAALPYFIVAGGLMYYNYIRFGNPFEFGQAYQLTVVDQSQYKITLDSATILRIINESTHYFFDFGNINKAFPYFRTSSLFFNFPILFMCIGAFKSSVLKSMKEKKITSLVFGIFSSVLIITAMDIIWSPYLLERYRMDIYFLMGIACFIVIGLWYNSRTEKQRNRLSSVAVIFSSITIVSSFFLYVYTVGLYYPDKITEIATSLHLI